MAVTAKLLIEGCIAEKGTFLEGMGIDDCVFSAVDCREFLEANADADTIEVEIRSNGGSIMEGPGYIRSANPFR